MKKKKRKGKKDRADIQFQPDLRPLFFRWATVLTLFAEPI